MPADATSAATRFENRATALGSLLETEAAEHERQFRETLEHCPAGLIVVDENGRLLFHNARLRELLGYSKEEMELIDTRSILARPRPAFPDHRNPEGPRRHLLTRR